MIERVSGMSTAAFMEQNIFHPLGMEHATFKLIEGDALTDGTVSYTYLKGKNRFKKTNKTHNMLGATGVHCTLRDLSLWQSNFEHNRLGKGDPGLMRQMEAMYSLKDGTPIHYGAGLFLKNYRGLPTIEHGGGWNSFLMQNRRFPDQGISIIVASNNDLSSPFPIADAICDQLFSFKNNPPRVASGLGQLKIPVSSLEGKYLSFNNRLRHVRKDADTLKIRLDESASRREIAIVLDPKGCSDSLLNFMDPITGYQVQFIVGAQGRINGFFWEGGDYFQCRRFYEKLDDNPVSAKQWVGKYKVDQFPQKVRIRQGWNQGSLKMKPVFFMSYQLIPVTGTVFSVKGERLLLRFTEHGFLLGDDWVSNLKFSKLK